MLETESLCYIDLDKTGCTHVTKILETILKETIYFAKHHPVIDETHLELIAQKKSFITIRNPWDWYVSMWRFGCTGRQSKGIYGYFKGRNYQDIYYSSDYDNIEVFQRWFHYLHDFSDVVSYVWQPFNIGMCTHAYLNLKYPNFFNTASSMKSLFENMEEFDDNFNYLDGHVRTHVLEEDLIAFLTEHCQDFIDENYQQIIWDLKKKPENISHDLKKRSPYTDFYTDEMRDMVAKNDRLIIKRGDFTFSIAEDLSNKF